jgi:TonB family protein
MANGKDELRDDEELGLVPIFTMVLWLTCLAVFLVGVIFDDSSGAPATRPTAATSVELLSVELSNDTQPIQNVRAPSHEIAVASQEPVIPTVRAAPIAPVAAGSAFADYLPLLPMRTFAPSPAAPLRLTFGQGEGRQPAPDYPREAALAGEEGTVVARFDVDENGRVKDAEVMVPCPWPLLNQSVLRTIRHDWRFSPGPPRSYEVPIDFRINRR